jgi:hypothetical protein
MMPDRRWARISLAAGAAVLALVMASTVMPPPRCGTLPSSYPPIIAFELARTEADLLAVFGPPGRCRDAMVEAMDAANLLDLAAFMPAYGLFLVAWFWSRRRAHPRAAAAGAALSIVAVVADAIENACLVGLTPGLDATSPWLARLPWATGAKWIGLGAAAIASAAILARGGRAAKVGAAVSLAAPVVAVGAVAAPSTFGPIVTPGIALAWVACLVATARAAFTRESA